MTSALVAATTAMAAAVIASSDSGSARRPALWPSLLPPDRHGRDDLCVVSAKGVRVSFLDGSTALCATSGLWNVPLGYGDPVITETIAEATARASYAGVFRYENVDARRAAEDLVNLTARRYARVLFSTSGAAANDTAMKLVRHYWALRGEPRRKVVLSLDGSYHGLTFGAFALTGEDLGQDVYAVDRRLVRHVPANDVGALGRAARDAGQVAAIVVEPVLGTGTVPLTADFVRALGELREATGVLVVVDEVATGFGRTGPMFASETWPFTPDVLITSKGMTNGTVAAAALLVAPHVADVFDRSGAVLGHGETQAGTAASCAAVSATVRRFRELDALRHGRTAGDRLARGLEALVREHVCVVATSGAGCFRSISVRDRRGRPLDGAGVVALVAAVRRHGTVVHPGPSGLQLVPALVSSPDEIDEALASVRRALDELAAGTEVSS